VSHTTAHTSYPVTHVMYKQQQQQQQQQQLYIAATTISKAAAHPTYNSKCRGNSLMPAANHLALASLCPSCR